MSEAGIHAYRESSLGNASGSELVLACFREAHKALSEARDHIEGGTAASSYGALEKVRRIYTHLYSTLDLAAGGDLALKMQQLYVYVIEQTLVVASSYDLKQLEALESINEDMRSAWQQISTQAPPPPSENPVQSIAASA